MIWRFFCFQLSLSIKYSCKENQMFTATNPPPQNQNSLLML